jgi:hypothetical protein
MYAAGFGIEIFCFQKCREVMNLYADEPLVFLLIFETSICLKYNLNFVYPNYSCNFIELSVSDLQLWKTLKIMWTSIGFGR